MKTLRRLLFLWCRGAGAFVLLAFCFALSMVPFSVLHFLSVLRRDGSSHYLVPKILWLVLGAPFVFLHLLKLLAPAITYWFGNAKDREKDSNH